MNSIEPNLAGMVFRKRGFRFFSNGKASISDTSHHFYKHIQASTNEYPKFYID